MGEFIGKLHLGLRYLTVQPDGELHTLFLGCTKFKGTNTDHKYSFTVEAKLDIELELLSKPINLSLKIYKIFGREIYYFYVMKYWKKYYIIAVS